MVKSFKELTPEFQELAGGKGGRLAKMFQEGYPVPDGFVILSSAFEKERLDTEAWNKIILFLNLIRENYAGAIFAVRSSALSEDSEKASFAGEFETVLSVKTDEDILAAIYTVYRSKHSQRVKAYSFVQGIEQSHQIAVVVQLMVESEIAGVLFTADPITGSHKYMEGNYVYGLGEQLVSGEVDAIDFKIFKPRSNYKGPKTFKKYAAELYKLAEKLEKRFAHPQDIEWAVSEGKLFILQSRPISNLGTINYDTYEINESRDGDFLWTNNNVGEAIPDVMTPFTWSLIRELDLECQKITGYYMWSGNICGRVYTNISMILSIMPKFGISVSYGKKLIGDVFGNIPDYLEIPLYPFSRIALIRDLSQRGKKSMKRIQDAKKNKEYYLNNTQKLCSDMIQGIAASDLNKQLLDLWIKEIRPYVSKLWTIWLGGASSTTLVTLRKKLVKLVGEEDSNLLLSNLRGDNGLESLGPLIGIMKISKGELTNEEYTSLYGHRSPHEFEMSIPYPSEDSGYLEKQIAEYKKSGVDVESLLYKQHEKYTLAKERFFKRYPAKKKWFEKNMLKIIKAAQLRESLRSEFIKTFRVMRIFMLRLGELTGIGENAFYLYSFEVPELLCGNTTMLKHIKSRRQSYEKYKTLPTLPQFVRGHIDPFKWSQTNDRSIKYYDPSIETQVSNVSYKMIKGFAGAAGKVEGNVRVLTSYDEADSFLMGEILVTSTTNIGWTPIFPRAAAIITDIGAPLSHAAIVARELGIPAVVGCGNATTNLKTGDRVIVNGGQGIVTILKKV